MNFIKLIINLLFNTNKDIEITINKTKVVFTKDGNLIVNTGTLTANYDKAYLGMNNTNNYIKEKVKDKCLVTQQ